MARPASSRTVSASTDSSAAPAEAPPAQGARAASRVAAPVASAGRAASARVSHFWTTAAWRQVKAVADRVLLVVVVTGVGWAATNAVFVAQRAVANRAVANVHLSNQPIVRIIRAAGGAGTTPVVPTVALRGMRTERVSIGIANDGSDGVVLKSGTLTGPYLAGGAVQLAVEGNGYLRAAGTVHMNALVTVDCDAAAPAAEALASTLPSPLRQPTGIAISVTDANGNVHRSTLVIDTTAFAVQGQVCTA
jgi:hypothetical protein